MLTARACSSVYQDVPLYTLDEFKQQAPEDSRTEQILVDEHQLMLSRLNFELSERQRFVLHYVFVSVWPPTINLRLDQQRKELSQQKEELLKQNKNKLGTLDSVKSYIDALTKVCSIVPRPYLPFTVSPRLQQKHRKNSTSSCWILLQNSDSSFGFIIFTSFDITTVLYKPGK